MLLIGSRCSGSETVATVELAAGLGAATAGAGFGATAAATLDAWLGGACGGTGVLLQADSPSPNTSSSSLVFTRFIRILRQVVDWVGSGSLPLRDPANNICDYIQINVNRQPGHRRSV
jgi:hypothetical protein